MADKGQRIKTIIITLERSKGAFSILQKLKPSKEEGYDFSGIATLRQLLSNEKARLLQIIKSQKPGSIYELAKISGRSFKSVNEDLKLLKRMGFIEIAEKKVKKRVCHMPKLIIDTLLIQFRI